VVVGVTFAGYYSSKHLSAEASAGTNAVLNFFSSTLLDPLVRSFIQAGKRLAGFFKRPETQNVPKRSKIVDITNEEQTEEGQSESPIPTITKKKGKKRGKVTE